MIKCTPLTPSYSRHKLAYENEAVFLTYSYITTNSQTTENKAMILAWPRWKITEQAELQLDCRERGCMLPSRGTRLLQKAAAQLQHFAQYSSLTALAWWDVLLSLQKLSLSLGRSFHGKTDTSEPDNSMPSILFSLHRFLVANGWKSMIL